MEKVKIIDPILPNYGATYYILWESKAFLHLGITPEQTIATCYAGRNQCEIIEN